MKIVAENLGKRFNREWIFKNFNFEFSSPNIYVITGPNGSGKSTLLQILWGQMIPSQGTITYHALEKKIDLTEIFKYTSIATPYMELIEEFTLVEQINFHFKFKNTLNNWSASEILERLELLPAKDKHISNFSSGMKQRLKLGLAFYSNSQIIFLDEPSTNLDKNAFDWYRKNLEIVKDRLVIMASNQENEYPAEAVKIDILKSKKGY